MAEPLATDRSFRQQLDDESERWVEDALISAEQRQAILARYPAPQAAPARGAIADPPTAPRKHLSFALPAIVIGLAGVLLCTGIVLFYAANWRVMPPTLKFAQVIALILATYGTAFVLQLLTAFALAMFIGPDAGLSFGVFAGFMAGALFVATAMGVVYLFEQRSFALWGIDAGYQILAFTLMGGILGAW